MKVREIVSVIYDKLNIYKGGIEVGGFENIYVGESRDVPVAVLEMEVLGIVATVNGDRGIINIWVPDKEE